MIYIQQITEGIPWGMGGSYSSYILIQELYNKIHENHISTVSLFYCFNSYQADANEKNIHAKYMTQLKIKQFFVALLDKLEEMKTFHAKITQACITIMQHTPCF